MTRAHVVRLLAWLDACPLPPTHPARVELELALLLLRERAEKLGPRVRRRFDA